MTARRPGAWIRSKVAWRLLLLFLLCAVVPTTVVAVVGYHELATALRKDGDQRLQRASQSIGHELLGRLAVLEATLEGLDERLAVQEGPWPRALLSDVSQSFSEITYRGEGERHILLGTAVEFPFPPETREETRARLEEGASAVTTVFGSDGEPSLLLTRRGAHGTWTARARIGAIIPSWEEEARAVSTEFCAFNGRGRVIGCSAEELSDLDLAAATLRGSDLNGAEILEHASGSLLAVRQPISFGPDFYDPGHLEPWAVVVVIPRAEVFGPLDAFHGTFTLLATLTIAFATLLSLTQIRRQLGPLEELGRGTRRLAEGDFNFSLDIRSGDDFESLADSFNKMTARLRTQFESLQHMVEIDRSILSEITAARVLETMVERVGELFPARVAVALSANEKSLLSTTYTRTAGVTREHHSELQSTELERWFPGAEARSVLLQEGGNPGETPAYAPLLSGHGALRWTAIPLRFHADIVAVLLLGSECEASPDEALFARQLAAQCAVALANARTLERNRVLAYYDALTELPNRLLYRERLNQALRRARRHNQPLAVIILDLDDFKRINDTLGHDAGDRLLSGVASRLSLATGAANQANPNPPTIARTGGDEFMVLLEDIDGIAAIARFAERMRKAVGVPDIVEDHDVTLDATVGIAMYPEDGDDLETLLRNADTALHHAKDHGRHRYEFFNPSMNESAARRLATEAGLRRALERDELQVYYQPIVDASDRSPVGMEALVRWQHPERGLISPGEFIDVAESTGLVLKLGEFVMQRACAQAARLHRELGLPLRLAINASPRQLRESDLVPVLLGALQEGGLSPSCLTLEITEGIMAEANPELLRQLASLKHAGIQIAIDDFGTGYSSLAYLKQFPVDTLKIDQSFTAAMLSHREDRAIVDSVISLAHGLGLGTVVEGVEREEQLTLLREIGCDRVQGHLFAPAMPADEFAKWVRDQSA